MFTIMWKSLKTIIMFLGVLTMASIMLTIVVNTLAEQGSLVPTTTTIEPNSTFEL